MRQFLILCALLSLGSFSACTRVFGQETKITEEQQIEATAERRLKGKLRRQPTAEEVEKEKVEVKKLLEYYKVIDNKRFHFKGEVVDEEGNRLNEVKLHVTRYVLGTMPFSEGHYEGERFIVNDTFDINVRNGNSATLTFEKDGYYKVVIENIPDLTSKERARIQEKIMKGEPVENPLITKEGLRIVMEKRGETTFLSSTGGQLQYSANGTGQILNFNLIHKGDNPVFQKSANVENEKQLPKNCIYIIAEKDETGKIATVSYRRSGYSGPSLLYPKKIRLFVNTDEDWGLIAYEPKNIVNPYHEMKKAPEMGYEKEIIVDLSTLGSIEQDAKKDAIVMRMFYFKLGGKYGKAQLAVFPNEPIAIMGGNFRLQPNGSRNLETGE